jgi:hypothetical protein
MVHHDPNDSHGKDDAVGDRIHGRPDQLLRPVLYPDAQHSRTELEELQRQAMGIRFQQHRESIEILRKLADRLGITALNEFNDVVPLLFSHTAFKSYPAALVDKKRFDLMTKWLDKLTSYDLSDVDTAGCTGIDDWIDRLDEQTPLEVIRFGADCAGPQAQRHHHRARGFR